MLFQSQHLRVTAEHGVASLWLAFPGAPTNALSATRFAELDSALTAIQHNPFLHTLVIRSAKPHGFCEGLHPVVAAVAARGAFAWNAQRVFARLSELQFTTVAFIEGPCLGVGMELALACDVRVCVATANTHLGFPTQFTCAGGSNRLRKRIGKRAACEWIESGHTLSGREARERGIVDRVCCARRAKIELRTLLDELERNPRVPVRDRDETGFAEERRAFASLDLATRLAVTHAPITDVAVLLTRGFITPLEAEQLSRGTETRAVPVPETKQLAELIRQAA